MNRTNISSQSFLITLFVFLTSFTDGNKKLERNHWDDSVYVSLNELITEYANKGDYAVFDFDNTTIFHDIEEALQIYQIEHLRYAFYPNEIFDILTTGIPNIDIALSQSNSSLTVRNIATDISDDYKVLYKSYKGFAGKKNLEEVHKMDEYLDFRAKLRFLYEAINSKFDSSVAYPWILYQFTGMNTEELQQLTRESTDYALNSNSFGKKKWISPRTKPGKSGLIEVEYYEGLRIPDEIKDLFQCLRDNGIEVYICSASLKDVVSSVASDPKYGLNIESENIFGMMLAKDIQGKYCSRYDTNYEQTIYVGKVKTIKNNIAVRHKGNDPILVAGDSDGDYNMLTEFPDMKLGLVIHRGKKGEISSLYSKKNYLLQGRDNKTGKFIEQMHSIN